MMPSNSPNSSSSNWAGRLWSKRPLRITAGLFLLIGMGQSGGICGTNTGGGGNGGGNNGGGNNGGSTNTINLLASDHILGDPNATVVVVEYSDFQCPFCGRFARQEYATIKQNYIDTGKIRFVFRHFPLRNIHNRAEAAARSTECANDQGKFFEFHDLVFNTTDANGPILTDAQLQAHAATLSLNTTTFNACFPPGDSKAARVQQDVNSGTALAITGTPTFFINGQRLSGFQTAAQLSAVIDQKLAGN